MESAKELCQHILDTDTIDTYPQYKTLCNYMLLEGLCYDVGYKDVWHLGIFHLIFFSELRISKQISQRQSASIASRQS